MTYPSVHITLKLQQVLEFVQQLPFAYQEALFAISKISPFFKEESNEVIDQALSNLS